MSDRDWRFKDFQDTNGAYNQTPVSKPVTDGNVSAAARLNNPSGTNWNATFKGNQPASPSGTNWNATFGNNNPTSPSGTNWQKAFPSATPSPSAAPSPFVQTTLAAANRPASFSLGLDRSNYGSQLSLANTPASSFYRDRFANMDVTPRDRQMYGAGDEFGFHTY